MPSATIYDKLAVATWWEPSKQVSSYVASTLRTVSMLPSHSRLHNKHAGLAAQLVRPVDMGIQTSHNLIISQFLETLKSSVNMKAQYVTSEESAFPRNIFLRSTMKSR